MEEMIWQEHTYALDKAPGVGFGIAVGGSRDNTGFNSSENSIVISDVVPVGPAVNRLQVNDIIIRINGKPTYNMGQGQAVRELKSCGNRVELTIKRKVFVRVERDTPPPGTLRRSKSRDLDSLPRSHRNRSRSRGRNYSPASRSGRYRSRSRDLDYSPRRRSRSRDLDRSPRRRSSTDTSRRRRSRSRNPDRSPRRRSRSRNPDRSPRRRSRSRNPDRSPRRRSRSRDLSRSTRSESLSPRRDSPPPRSRRSWSRSSSEASLPPRHSPSPVSSRVQVMRPSSPLSPDKEGFTPNDDFMVFPVKSLEPQTIVLNKTKHNNSYGLKLGTRIFVQDIQPGSLADKSKLISAGDTVFMINGRNMDNKTVQEAIQTIGLSKDKVTMVVKKQDGGTVSIPANKLQAPAPVSKPAVESSSDEDDNVPAFDSKIDVKANSTTESDQPVAPRREKKNAGVKVLPAVQTSSSVSSKDDTASNKAPSAQPEYSLPPDEEDDDDVRSHTASNSSGAVREIQFAKGKNVGIRLAGGNDVGIFVASVLESSPAAKQGLKMGDQILSVNGVNFRNIIREEAVLTLMGLPTGEYVHIVTKAQPKAYERILERGTGDSFYVRTHFKYERDGDHEMSFKQGSTFRISDTLYQGMVGYWLGARIGRNNMDVERGVIPNRSRAEQLKMVQDRKVAQSRERARGGIGRRMMKNQKSENTAPSVASSMFPAYERVVLREAGFKRPVVIFGPLADIARERLACDHSDLYEIAGNEGIVSGQKSNRKGIIRLNTIKDIIEKDKHAILDITPAAVEKLNYTQLYPIVVFLEASSKQVVKELRSRLACTDVEKKKKPGKLYDRAQKMQRGYNYVFTDTIVLTAGSDDWYRRLYSTIKDQQSMPVWVSEDRLPGGEEIEADSAIIPDDDDKFSYVSAPASDYSVTTAGSDFLNSTIRSEDDVTQPARQVEKKETREPPAAPQSSSSSSDEDAGTQFKDDDFDELDADVDDEPQQPPESPVPEAPPREKRSFNAKPPAPVSSSESSVEEEVQEPAPQPPIIMPKPYSDYGRGRHKIRGNQEIPPGRFDPQSFLKSHIKTLNKTAESPPASRTSPVEPASSQPVNRAPEQPVNRPPEQPVSRPQEPPVNKPAANSVYMQQRPPPTSTGLERNRAIPEVTTFTAKPFNRNSAYSKVPQMQHEVVYAQVDKNRPKFNTPLPSSSSSVEPPVHDHSPSARDYGAEIDEFISSDPYKTRPTNNRPPTASSTTNRFAAAKPQNQYNRFAGSSSTKPAPKPTNFASRAPIGYKPTNGSNPPPVKSKFMQDNYRGYMNQMKQSSTAFNPRPYTKPSFPPVTRAQNISKDQMYDSGVDTYDNAKPKKLEQPAPPINPPPDEDVDADDAQIVATASGVFDSNGGVLSSVETGVSIVIPKGAIRPGIRQSIYFKVCRDNTAIPPLDREKGETLLSPLVMCGPHGLQFEHPVELRLPHSEPSEGNMDMSSNSVSVLIDHF